MIINGRTIAVAQITLSVVYLSGYFAMLGCLILGYIATPIEWKEVLMSLISVLTAGVLLILNFWFARTRETT